MTLTFKDPNGVEWDLIARRAYGIKRPVEPADLLSALGQLSTGSDGPTDEELWRIDQAALAAVPDEASVRETNTAALRALFAAGFASRQAEVDRLTAELADEKRHSRNQRGELNRFNRQVRADYEAMPLRHQLESELTATRAKLAEVERSRDLHSQERQRLDREERKLLAEIDELTHELASARRVVEAVNATLEKGPRYTDRHMEAAADAVADEIREAMALASAGTGADRAEAAKCSPLCVNPWCPNRCWPPAATEPPRPEAGEPRCEHCNMREHAYSKGGRCPLGPSGRHSFDDTTAEPKPEPQPSGFALPWRVEHVMSIRDERGQPVVSSVLDADGKRVASLVTPERAAFIVARCNAQDEGLAEAVRHQINRLRATFRTEEELDAVPYYRGVIQGKLEVLALLRSKRQPEVERDDGSDEG